MTGARQHIFAGARITDNQQRRIEHRQLARLFHHLTHFRTDRDDMLKLAVVVDRQVLQLAAHARRRFQHHHRADRQRGALFLGGVNRTRLQQEVAPLDHYVLRLRLYPLALQPAGKVKAAHQRGDAVVADFMLIQTEQALCRRVRQLHFALHIDREHRFRHGGQQRAQRAMLAL